MRKRKDNNHKSIVNSLSQLPGIKIHDISSVGGGIGDILLGFRGKNFLFEIKNPEQCEAHKRLTSAEKKFHETWTGQISTVESVEDILTAINYKSNWS